MVEFSGTIEAFHCGRNLQDNAFSLKHVGSGEGMLYLGPGIYFITNEKMAKLYAKYVNDAYLYRVNIKTEGLYNPNSGLPLHLRDKISELGNHVMKELGINEIRLHGGGGDSFKYGKGIIGTLVKNYGREQALSMLNNIGINGIYEALPSGAIEIAVYDLSIISMLEKIKLEPKKKDEPKCDSKVPVYEGANFDFVEYGSELVPNNGNIHDFETAHNIAVSLLKNKPDTVLNHEGNAWWVGKIDPIKFNITASASKKDKDPNHQYARKTFFKNYDYTSDKKGDETSPGGGLFHGEMDKYKSVKDFIDQSRKRKNHTEKPTTAARINWLKKISEELGKK